MRVVPDPGSDIDIVPCGDCIGRLQSTGELEARRRAAATKFQAMGLQKSFRSLLADSFKSFTSDIDPYGTSAGRVGKLALRGRGRCR
jgi:hypothetical protein